MSGSVNHLLPSKRSGKAGEGRLAGLEERVGPWDDSERAELVLALIECVPHRFSKDLLPFRRRFCFFRLPLVFWWGFRLQLVESNRGTGFQGPWGPHTQLSENEKVGHSSSLFKCHLR